MAKVSLRAATAGIALAAWLATGGAAHAQSGSSSSRSAASLAYLKDMPAPEEIMAAIQGSTPAQTLGRQCAALERVMRGGMFPDLQFRAEGQPVVERYRAALAALERRYAATVKPLGDPANAAEWHRMCRNARSGIHPATGQPDAAFPALERPVTPEEIAAVFKPTVRAAYEAGQRDNARLAASQTARNESMRRAYEARQQQERRERLQALALGAVAALVTLALVAWLFVATRRMGWRVAPDGRSLLINTRPFEVIHHGGFLRAVKTDREVKITGGGTAPNGRHVPASSVTIVHDYLRLLRVDGTEYDVHLRDWDLGAVPGDVLQFYRLKARGSDTASPDYLVIVNRQTGAMRVDGRDWLRRRLSPMHGPLAFVAVVASGFFSLGLGWLIGGAWLWHWQRTTGRCEREIHAWLRDFEPLHPAPAGDAVTPA